MEGVINMCLETWAEKEIELACQRERDSAIKAGHEEDAEYGTACYQSALKAFKSLLEDGHSGMSISITRHILNRLILGEPLSPITGEDDEWEDRSYAGMQEGVIKEYQNKRMSSLFKYVYADGTVKYSDVQRVTCYESSQDDTHGGTSFQSGFINRIIDEVKPITLPYVPQHFKVYVTECLYEENGGDFDTRMVDYMVDADTQEQTTIGRYFKEDPESDGWVEISNQEYQTRWLNRIR